MDQIRLQDGQVVEARVNGLTIDGQEAYALIAPTSGDLNDRLSKSREIEVMLVDGIWTEKAGSVNISMRGHEGAETGFCLPLGNRSIQ